MSQIKTEAIVIKSINWSDTSKIVSLYTRENGRVDAVAKGARRKNHQYGNFLESLNHLETIIYISDKRELQNLGNTSLLNSFYKIRQNLDKTAFGLAILELINTFFQQGENDPVFFDFLLTQIQALDQTSQPQVIFWYFILKLASYLGFKPHFNHCKICEEIKNEDYYFQISTGSVYCLECIGDTNLFIKIPDQVYQYLNKLQKANYKQIADYPPLLNYKFNSLNFLLDYLRHHTEQKIELASLKLL